jgi:glutaminase
LKFFQKFDIGEAFSISEIYKTLNAVDGVVDTLSVEIEQRIGSNYSGASFDLDSRTTPDGRWIDVPRNVIMEVKYTDNDIKGSVK